MQPLAGGYAAMSDGMSPSSNHESNGKAALLAGVMFQVTRAARFQLDRGLRFRDLASGLLGHPSHDDRV